MIDDEDIDDAEAARVGAELEALTPEPRERWRGDLGGALHVEAARRGVGRARPTMLWVRAGVLVTVGAALLVAAATRL